MIAGIPFADHRGMAFDYVLLQYAANIIFFFILVISVNTVKKLKTTIFMVCISTFFFSTRGLIYDSLSKERFSTGTMYDPNDLAFILVSIMPFFFFFTKDTERMIVKLFGLSGIVISILSIFLTGSRGGFIGLLILFSLVIFSKIVTEKLSVKLLLVSLAAITLFYNTDKINFERLRSISDLSSDYNVTSETGRLEIWKRGFKLVTSNPITGVGANCFGRAIGYQRDEEGEVPRWQAPHNSYLQILAEIGFIGFLVFMSLIIATLQNFRNMSNHEIKDDDLFSFSYAAKVLKLGFIGCLICSFFLSQAYSIIFTLFFALSAAMRNLYLCKEECSEKKLGLE